MVEENSGGQDVEQRMRLEYLDPRSLTPNPKNHRKHGGRQRQVFSDVLDEVGMVDAVVWNERTGRLLDGHMRVEEFIERNEKEMPVLVVDLPEDKEHLALFFKDRIAAMANVDNAAEKHLAEIVDTEKELLDALAREVQGLANDLEELDPEKSAGKDDKRGIGLNPGEGFNYVVLLFRTNIDWYAAQEHFGVVQVHDPLNTNRISAGRIVDGGDYLKRLASLR